MMVFILYLYYLVQVLRILFSSDDLKTDQVFWGSE